MPTCQRPCPAPLLSPVAAPAPPCCRWLPGHWPRSPLPVPMCSTGQGRAGRKLDRNIGGKHFSPQLTGDRWLRPHNLPWLPQNTPRLYIPHKTHKHSSRAPRSPFSLGACPLPCRGLEATCLLPQLGGVPSGQFRSESTCPC